MTERCTGRTHVSSCLFLPSSSIANSQMGKVRKSETFSFTTGFRVLSVAVITTRLSLLTAPWEGLDSAPPHPDPLPLGRGRMVHRLSITPVPEFVQRPSAEHHSRACCSLSLRERVRVRGKYSVEHAKRSISQGLLSNVWSNAGNSLIRFFSYP